MPSSMITISIWKVVPPDGAVRNTIASKVKFFPSVTTGGALRLNVAAEGRESELAGCKQVPLVPS